MTTIKDSALTYVPNSTKNITELAQVSVDFVLQEKVGKDKDGKEFSYNFVEINGEQYRVPDQVLKNLKAILEKKPNLRTFAVSKSGEGRNTTYTVIPLD